MSELWADQTSNIDGTLSRIIMSECYAPNLESAIQELRIFPVIMDSSLSPPLSEFEMEDIHVAEAEFTLGNTETYENAQDLITALHASRERYKREARREP